jgi:hypothetical protein
MVGPNGELPPGAVPYVSPTPRAKRSSFRQSSTTIINLNGIVDGESARRSIERVMQESSIRTGAINLNGAAL